MILQITKEGKCRLVLSAAHVTMNHAAPRYDVPLRHSIEQFPGIVDQTQVGICVDDGVPGWQVWVRNFVEHLVGKGDATTGRVHVDEGGLHKGVAGETQEEDLGMELASAREVGWGVEGLEEEWKGVEIGRHGMEAHAKVDGERCGFGSASNEVVPDKRFHVGVGKMKTWVRT